MYNKEFGYSRKDVLIIIVGLIGLGVVMYEGLQAMGMDAGIAGNWVQATIFLGICIGWVSTYLWRVANKVQQFVCQGLLVGFGDGTSMLPATVLVCHKAAAPACTAQASQASYPNGGLSCVSLTYF